MPSSTGGAIQPRECDTNCGEVDPRLAWAVRFSATMIVLNPGVRILFRWLTGIVVLITAWRIPEALTWLE